RHDHDPVVADGVSQSIFFLVEADQRAARNEDVAVDDGAPDARVAADAHAGHQDALIDVAEAVDANVGAENTAGDAAAGNDAPGRNDRVERLSAPAAFVGEHEL